MIETLQKDLNTLQALPIVGPFIFSPIKLLVSKAQIISGIALGVFFKIQAAIAFLREMPRTYENYQYLADKSFDMSFKGGLHWFYACANFATLGILGICVELTRRNIVEI